MADPKPQPAPGSGPEVTVVMPNFNCGAYIEDSIRSALAQTVDSIEVVVIDDCSTDDSVARARALEAAYPGQVRVFVQDVNQGSAAARNRAFAEAKGDWIAVLDSDDLMAPERLRRLIDLAKAKGADMVADDMILFYDDGKRAPHRHLTGPFSRKAQWVSLATFIEENHFFARHSTLGYLKPVIRAEAWRKSGVWYDPRLRLAQDYGFVQQLLEAGLSFFVSPTQGYFYRKHNSSNSHSLKASHIVSLQQVDAEFAQRLPHNDFATARALDRRRRSVQRAADFDALVAAIKARSLGRAAAVALRNPTVLPLLAEPVRARVERLKLRASRYAAVEREGPQAVIMAMEPLDAGDRHGVLAQAARYRREGVTPHLVQPAAGAYAGQAQVALPEGAEAFATIAVHGFRHAGGMLVREAAAEPGPPGVLTDDDLLFAAAHAHAYADQIAIDTPAARPAVAYAIRPHAPVTLLGAS